MVARLCGGIKAQAQFFRFTSRALPTAHWDFIRTTQPQAADNLCGASAAMLRGRTCGPARDHQPLPKQPDSALAKAADAAAGA
ncbi:MAG TPA: hypothetical protein VGM87_10860 [Roseomonas sp.]|jgi:hypothetical protein